MSFVEKDVPGWGGQWPGLPSLPAGKTHSPVARVPTGHGLPCSSSFLPPSEDVRCGQPMRPPP